MSWRVARSLDVLLGQLNTLAPNRNRASDGSIGDAAHQAQGSRSDHNPWYVLNGQSLVTARDFTHDPTNGMDCHKLAAALAQARDPRLKYMIWQGKIMDSRSQFRPWTWQPSSGHYQHLHLSVMPNASADDTRAWALPGLTGQEADMQLDELLGSSVKTPDGRWVYTRDALGSAPYASLLLERQVIPPLQAMVKTVAAIAANPAVTPEFLSGEIDKAVEKHTPSAEQVAAAQLPHLQDAIREVLGQDNQELAEQIVTHLAERIRPTSPAVQ